MFDSWEGSVRFNRDLGPQTLDLGETNSAADPWLDIYPQDGYTVFTSNKLLTQFQEDTQRFSIIFAIGTEIPVGEYKFDVTLGEYNFFHSCTYTLTVEIFSEMIDGEIGPSDCGSWSRRRRLSASTAEDLLYFPTFSGWTGEIELNVVQDYELMIYNLTPHERSDQFYWILCSGDTTHIWVSN